MMDVSALPMGPEDPTVCVTPICFPEQMLAYGLSFSTDIRFRFMASPEAERLLQFMAQVMGLEATTDTERPVIFFTRRGPSRTHFAKEAVLPAHFIEADDQKGGWRSMELPFMRMWLHPHTPHRLCQLLYWDSVVSDSARVKGALNPIYLKLVEKGGLPIHGALIQYRNRGLLFLGQGGVGKSTACARLTPPFLPLSDDETVILHEGNRFFGHPMPTWSRFQNDQPLAPTGIGKRISIDALFFLKQGAETRISPMGAGEAAVRICQASLELLATYPFFSRSPGAEAKRKYLFDTACRIANQVPAHTLSLSLSQEFMNEVAERIDTLPERRGS
jgi:SynChlorMet cassette protein ScmC